jgi:hypothetical protein
VNSLISWNKAGAATNAINTVRIPLNEACWLGIDGVPAAYSGANYQNFIKREVADLTAAGMYPVLDLHWAAPGSILPTHQDVTANADHSITFWTQVAQTFASNQAVMFDLFNEPHIWCNAGSGCPYSSGTYTQQASWAWTMYRDGGSYTYTANDYESDRTGQTFTIAGTQQLVNAIRGTGAQNVIMIEGLGFANAMDNWVNFMPKDPLGQLVAEIHTYTNSGANVNNTSSLDGMLSNAGITGHYPVYVGEFGEQICSGTGTSFATRTMNWADSHGYSYAAWGWDQGEGCNGPSLVTANDPGTPSTYGSEVKTHLQSLEN